MLCQKMNFKFEIIVHDDASTDSTSEIIKEYELKYPDIVKPTYQKENVTFQHPFRAHLNFGKNYEQQSLPNSIRLYRN